MENKQTLLVPIQAGYVHLLLPSSLPPKKIVIVVGWAKNIASRYDNIAPKISPSDTITIYRTSLIGGYGCLKPSVCGFMLSKNWCCSCFCTFSTLIILNVTKTSGTIEANIPLCPGLSKGWQVNLIGHH